GVLVWSVTARAGETVSDRSVLLTPGAYRLRLRLEATDNGVLPTLLFLLRGSRLTDPVGPALEDPTMEPMYVSEKEPSLYAYPDGSLPPEPYYVVEESRA